MLGSGPPGAIALHAARRVLAGGALGDAIEQQIAGRIARREIKAAVSGEPGDLKIDVFDPLLPGEDAVVGDLRLGLINGARGDRRNAVYRKAQAWNLVRELRDLILAARGPKNGSQTRRGIDDVRDVGKPFGLIGIVMDRMEGGCRVLDPLGSAQVFGGRVIIDRADRAPQSALGCSVVCCPPYIDTEPPGSRVPVLVWMSMTPVVRNPNCAGSLPEISATESASRVCKACPKTLIPSGS